MPLKKQEEFCRDEFDRWLKASLSGHHVIWEDNDNDPPDFWLILDSQRYAVEITRIVDEEDRTVAAALWRIIAEAKGQAVKAGQLFGTYLVEFKGRIDRGRGKLRNALKARVLDYVRRTAWLETDSGEIIEIGAKVLCKITKLHGRGASILPIGGPHDKGMGESEIRAELTELLKRSLGEKSRIPRETNYPTVLILYDLYWQIDQEVFLDCLNGLTEKTVFHTVYVVQDIGRGYMAYQTQGF